MALGAKKKVEPTMRSVAHRDVNHNVKRRGYLLGRVLSLNSFGTSASNSKQSGSQRVHIKTVISGLLLKSPNSEERY